MSALPSNLVQAVDHEASASRIAKVLNLLQNKIVRYQRCVVRQNGEFHGSGSSGTVRIVVQTPGRSVVKDMVGRQMRGAIGACEEVASSHRCAQGHLLQCCKDEVVKINLVTLRVVEIQNRVDVFCAVKRRTEHKLIRPGTTKELIASIAAD